VLNIWACPGPHLLQPTTLTTDAAMPHSKGGHKRELGYKAVSTRNTMSRTTSQNVPPPWRHVVAYLYRWETFRWNGWSSFALVTWEYMHMKRHGTHCVKTWRHPRNRKYITYRNDAREGPSHGHGQHAQKIWWRSRYATGQTDRQTDRHGKQTYSSQ